MVNRTYRNVMRTIRMIESKGYSFEEAKDIAIKKWDEYDMMDKKSVGHIERFINMIVKKGVNEND